MTREQEPLSWWSSADDGSMHWATVDGGRYVVTCRRDYTSSYWNAEQQHGRRVRQLGVAKTAEEAKARGQRDYDLAQAAEVQR